MYRNADILKIENIQKKYFYLTWKMTGWCNYHCPYCINSNGRSNFTKWVPEEKMIEKAKRLNTILENNKIILPLKIKLIGGEVCYYNLWNILDEFNNISKLLITTNFSRELGYYKKLYNYCNSRGISLLLILSYHSENIEFKEKVRELTYWCRNLNFPEPQIVYVVTPDFNFDDLEYYKENKINRLKFIVEKTKETSMITLSEEQQQKLEYYTKLYDSNSRTYKVTFKDGSVEYFSNIYQFLNKLDNGGFIADNYYCDAGMNKLTLSYDDILYLNRCKFIDNIHLGSIWDDIKIDNKNVLCKATDEDNPNFRCNLCSSISVWKNI